MKVGRSVEITIFSGICWSADYEVGVSNNPSIGRLFGSQLENAWMMLQYYQFSGNDITDYLPFIEQAVIFYDENFRIREKARSGNVSALSLPTVWAGIGQSISEKNTLLIATPKAYIERSGGWSQNVIHCARLGMTETAKKLIVDKIEDGPFRFPAFFPGGDYGPDHNVGGSGMIGLQEMLMQTHGGKIRLFPAWPQEWDVDFKLHAPGRTIVEVKREQGRIVTMKTSPRVDPTNLIIGQ